MKSLPVICVLALAALINLTQGCSDKKQSCSYWATMGYCETEYVEYMKINCPKTCKICDGGSGGSGQCGFKPSTRIVGGTEAPEGAWPWQAQIRTPSGFTFCGGTLVHPRWVVTAAHCTKPKTAGSIKVRLGAHYRSGTVGTEQDFNVEKIINHPSYRSPTGMAHDISLLKLSTSATLNRAVNLACLPGSSGSVAEGKRCWVTGFGRLASNGNMPKSLMQVMVPVVSQSRCKSSYGSSIHDSMICAGLDVGGKDSCQGDSGGPMVCEYNSKYFLEGVVSWGHGCADPRKYGVYARVRYLSQWVNQMMNSY